MKRVLFLPGASGSRAFWQPVADRLTTPQEKIIVGWPGFDGVAPDPAITSLSDLTRLVLAQTAGGAGIVAQSMGGVVAVQAALAHPSAVRWMVLVATSGGVDVQRLGAQDWRPEYIRERRDVPRWFVDDRTDVTDRLHELQMPVLLIWGDTDTISPVRVGQFLASNLKAARLVVIPEGTHRVAYEKASEVGEHTNLFLRQIEQDGGPPIR